MIPSEVSAIPDLDLIHGIKSTNKNEYITEAISRWSGSYVDMCKAYTYVPKFEMDELLQNKNANIYKYVMDYKPERGMKISTYVSQRIKWECQSKVNAYAEPEEIKENTAVDEAQPLFESKDIICRALDKIKNDKFSKIVKLRYFGSDVMPWKEIASNVGCSHEWARRIHDDNLYKLKFFIEKEMKNK